MTSIWKRGRRRAGRTWLLGRKALLQRMGFASGLKDKEAIFLSGMMRSGTNMTMDVLERSLYTDVFHERDPRAFDDYMMREPAVIHRLIDRSHAPRVVVKALLEAHRLDGLLTEFAPARAIWVYRNLDDSISSQLKSFGSPLKPLGRMATNPEEWDNWRTEGLTSNIRAVLDRHYREDMNDTSAAALFWLVRNLSFFEQKLETRNDIYVMRYEDGVIKPEPAFTALFEWLGIPFDRAFVGDIFATSTGKRRLDDVDGGIRAACDEVTARFDAIAATSE